MKGLKLVLGLVVLLITACSGMVINGVDFGKAMDISAKAFSSGDLSEKNERNMGAQMVAIVLGSAPVHSNKELQSYVNRVGYWVALHSERPKLEWQFAVVDTSAVNAFAMPGGFIVVTSGMLDLLSNEAELAAVLAHEIAHVNNRHYLKAMEKMESLSLASDIAFFAGDVYQANRGDNNREFYRNKAVAKKLLNTTAELYSKGLERGDEFEADSHAVTLVARAGYDPYAVAHVLQKLASLSTDDSNLQLLFNSHPKPDDRIDSVQATFDQLSLSQGAVIEKRFVQVMVSVAK